MVKKIVINIVVIIVVFTILAIVSDAFMPVFTNDMALDQLENDDMAYATWRLWNYVPMVFTIIRILTCVICGSNIFRTIYKNKLKKETD
jgi:hypothetical protein